MDGSQARRWEERGCGEESEGRKRRTGRVSGRRKGTETKATRGRARRHERGGADGIDRGK
jgi:hypothetical protein